MKFICFRSYPTSTFSIEMTTTDATNEHADEIEQNEPSAKKQKLTHTQDELEEGSTMIVDEQPKHATSTDTNVAPSKSFLPPSRALLGESAIKLDERSTVGHTLEFDVGISEYISKDLPPIHAIIKQRYASIYSFVYLY